MKKIIFLITLIPAILFGQELKYTNWVNDYADKLTVEQEASLNKIIGDFEKETSVEFAVAIVNSLDGNSPNAFTHDLFNKWGVGKKGDNNGLMIVIAPNERKWWTEVGYGLEEYLTDGYTKRVSEKFFPPNFRNDDYYTGLLEVINDYQVTLGNMTWAERQAEQEMLAIQREQKAQESAEATTAFLKASGWVLLFGSVIGVLVFLYLRKKRKERELKETIDNNHKRTYGVYNDFEESYSRLKLHPESSRIDINQNQYKKTLEELRILANKKTNSLEGSISDYEKIRSVAKPDQDDINRLISNLDTFVTIREYKHSAAMLVNNIQVRVVNFKYNNIGEYTIPFSEKELTSTLDNFQSTIRMIDIDFNQLANMKQLYEQAISYMNTANSIMKRHESALNDLYSAKDGIKKLLKSIPEDIITMNRKCKDSDVSYSTRTNAINIEKKYNNYSPNYQMLYVIASYMELKNISDKINAIYTKAKNEISSAESARVAAASAAAAAAAARRSSSSSTTSSGGGFGGFGGGMSGGGGSGGSW